MHNDFANIADEYHRCAGDGKNSKYLIKKSSSKPIPLLTQPGQEHKLDYASPRKNHSDKN